MAATDDISNAKLMDGIMKNLKRAAELGLIPQDGAKISARGEFIVDPSNIEDDENKRMRGYRHKNFPKVLHAWPEGREEPVELEVRGPAEEANAIAAGWSVDPVHGPGGRLQAGKAPEPEPEPVVRTFAPPGQPQPFEQASAAAPAVKPAATPAAKRGRPKK